MKTYLTQQDLHDATLLLKRYGNTILRSHLMHETTPQELVEEFKTRASLNVKVEYRDLAIRYENYDFGNSLDENKAVIVTLIK